MRASLTLPVIAIAASLAFGAGAASAQQLAYTGAGDDPLAAGVRERLASIARARGLGFVDLADAPPPASRAPELCAAGVAAYQELRVDAAEGALDQCLAEIARTGAAGLSTRQIADAHIYRAMVAIERGQAERSRDQLIAAATVSPSYQLDAARFRPSLIASFERARQAVARSTPAVVDIELGRDCRLRVDGAELTGAVELSLRPGGHYLEIRCRGFEPFAAAPSFPSQRQRFRPALIARRPERQRVLAATSAASIIWARLEGRRLELRRLERAGATIARRWRLELATPAAVERIDPIVASLIRPGGEAAATAGDPVVVVREPERRWYQRPWVWVAAGAVAGAAIVLPFALSGDSGGGFRVVPDGVPP